MYLNDAIPLCMCNKILLQVLCNEKTLYVYVCM